MVYSIGVLHHTNDPEYSFKSLVKATKIGGYITVGIYNPFREFRFRVKRGIVHLLAGKDIEKRVQIGQKLFFRRDHELNAEEWTGVADAYTNPYRRYYTFDQLLKWFKNSNVEFIDCLPPIRLSQNVSFAYEAFKSLLQGKGLNLTSAYHKTLEKNIQSKKWELNPIFTFITQILWLFIGRGTLINIVGKRIR